MFCSRKFTLKLNLWPKISLTYAISIVKWFFLEFLCKKIFLAFLCLTWITNVSQYYCENFRKIEQAELVKKLPPSYQHNALAKSFGRYFSLEDLSLSAHNKNTLPHHYNILIILSSCCMAIMGIGHMHFYSINQVFYALSQTMLIHWFEKTNHW